MTVCIIGAGGFLGQALGREYEKRGIQTRKFSSRDNHSLFDKTGLIRGDFHLPADCDCIVYLAQSPYYRDLPAQLVHVWNVNVVSAMAIARLACDAGVKRFIYTSTGTVYASSFSPLAESAPVRRDNWYALSKLHAEEGLMLYSEKLQVSILRLFGLYGPGQEGKLIPCLVNKVSTGNPVYIERAETDINNSEGLRISLCHVDDAASIIASLTNSDSCGILNISSDEVLSVRNIANQIAGNLQVEAVFADAENFRQGDLVADINKLKQIISPVFTPFADGLRELLSEIISEKV